MLEVDHGVERHPHRGDHHEENGDGGDHLVTDKRGEKCQIFDRHKKNLIYVYLK
jgi:hypothetical protein